MFWLRCCPRCGGDLVEDADWYGAYMACVQCAYYLTEAEEASVKFALGILASSHSRSPLLKFWSTQEGYDQNPLPFPGHQPEDHDQRRA